ncbi:cytochrome c3 family protein [Neobacillus sp. PS3-40]|uniref:multiheme c-type cytochrome n=1 Tax=Neobacillus sp. PS3-40 TaxID=3070679 RepID=UPI0027E1DD48|nr:cytochrome c3 family protein [Neobacillus sp. PS3-40]WML46063.1 cytochrome c3 family protein [Neobacillus sp. PS3-40]
MYEDSAGVTYDIFHYRKSTTRLGDISDNELCLRCHNADKVQKGEVQSDIQPLYIKTSSKHNFAALDGSNVTGPLPCAECHETHSSSNIKLLKNKLGQENQDGDFSAPSGGWNNDAEKQFCMKCHNGTTAVYGVVGIAVDDNHDLVNDPNYPNDLTKKIHLACSKCHGGTSQSFIEAAHAPQASTESPSP